MVEISFPPGLVYAATPASAPGRWRESNLVRWTNDGVLQAIGGWQKLTNTAMPSPIRKIAAVRTNLDIKYLFTATDAGLLVVDGSTFTDVTPSGFSTSSAGLADGYGVANYGQDGAFSAYGQHRTVGTVTYLRGFSYSLDSWGEQMIFCNSADGKIYVWNPSFPTTAATVISGAPTSNRAIVVTQERHLMALGAGGTPRRVAWSSSEDYTDWNYASITNTAGFFDLDAESPIVAGVEVREGVLVFCDESIWLVSFVGGDFIYGRQRLGSTSLLSPQSIVTCDGGAYWQTCDGKFMQYSAGQIQPLPCAIASWITSQMDVTYSTLRAHAGEVVKNELWFCFVSTSSPDGECDRVAVYNTVTSLWSMHSTLSRTAILPAGAHRYPLLSGTDMNLYQHESTFVPITSSLAGQIWIESNSVTPGGQQRIQRVQFDGGVSDGTSLLVKARDTRDGTDTTFGPYTPLSGRTAVRAGGQDLRIRLTSTTNNPVLWTVANMIVDVVPVGNR